MRSDLLLAVPNFSEGRDADKVAALASALTGDSRALSSEQTSQTRQSGPPFADGARLLDVHRDPDHHRSVFTLAAPPVALTESLMRAAALAVEQIDVMGPAGAGSPDAGQHPHVGALDVAPIVYLQESMRGAACAEALVLADRIGHELEVPVFLYGELTAAAGTPPRTRAQLRRGGIAALAERMRTRDGGVRPDFGPAQLHPRAGATLVAARPALVAFNMVLSPPADLAQARAIAASIREGGEHGLLGVRAIGVDLQGRGAQVSVNVERPLEVPLAQLVAAVRRLAPVSSCELVGLAPAAALAGFPSGLEIEGFDPARQVIENVFGG